MLIGLVHTARSPCRCAEFIGKHLRALGHETIDVDSDAIEASIGALVAADAVFDHTDTVAGRGLFRAVVRQLLEQRGVRVAGSSAAACFRADDKLAMREALARAGVPVAPGLGLERPDGPLPSEVSWPRVLKPCFEHMSRGVCLVRDEDELRREAARLLAEHRQPLVVERFIAGIEVGVTVLGADQHLRVLPPIGWDPESERETGLISWHRKLEANEETFHAATNLDRAVLARLEREAKAAFRALDLRDYARFDVRIDASGTPYFLDANTRPSLEESSPTIHAAAHAGMSYTQVLEAILDAALARPRPGFAAA
jgi:D-alanine-D-alanine ligase